MYTFPMVRARLAETAIKQLGRDGIVSRLLALGYPAGLVSSHISDRALAYRLAWRLLPAFADYVAPASADLSLYAVQNRTDAGTGRKGGENVR
jgi:hypothetical protein